jgi:hypothetical protein
MKTISLAQVSASSNSLQAVQSAKSEFKTFSLATAHEDGSVRPVMGVLLRVDLEQFNKTNDFTASTVEEVLWFLKHCTLDSVKELVSREEQQAKTNSKPTIAELMARKSA